MSDPFNKSVIVTNALVADLNLLDAGVRFKSDLRPEDFLNHIYELAHQTSDVDFSAYCLLQLTIGLSSAFEYMMEHSDQALMNFIYNLIVKLSKEVALLKHCDDVEALEKAFKERNAAAYGKFMRSSISSFTKMILAAYQKKFDELYSKNIENLELFILKKVNKQELLFRSLTSELGYVAERKSLELTTKVMYTASNTQTKMRD